MNILASNNSAFVCPKDLAFALGDTDAAIFLQQIHYWLERESGKVVNGVRWIYNTYSQWLDEFPHLTEWRLRSIVKLLKSYDVLKVAQLEKKQYKRRCWYTIDYKSLEALLGSNREIPTTRKRRKLSVDSEDSNGSSIYSNNSKQKFPTQEDNNQADADSCESEEFCFDDKPSCKESDLNEHPPFAEELGQAYDQEKESGSDRDNAIAARYNNNLLCLQAYGFELTKQLEKLATKYSEKEVTRSLEYLDECKEGGQQIQKPLGWLTECLKNEWWHDCAKNKEERLIIEALDARGMRLNTPEKFFDKLWQLIDEKYIDPMEITDIENKIGNYLFLSNEEQFFVNWNACDYQDRIDEGVIRLMSWREAVELMQT